MAVRPWRVAKTLDTLLAEINARSPKRSKASDGSIGDAAHATRSSDHNPWVLDGATGVVTARDFTHDPGDGFDAGAFAEWLRKRCDAGTEARVKYIISNRRIASATFSAADKAKGRKPWQWWPYSGVNAHTQHVHVSVDSRKAFFDSTKSWGWNAPAPAPKPVVPADPMKAQVELTKESAAALSTKANPRKAGEKLTLGYIIRNGENDIKES